MKYVALDGVIEGSWYEELGQTETEYTYMVWNFHEDHSFTYTIYTLRPSEDFSISRTSAQGGGQYRYDGDRLQLTLSYGDSVSVCGSTIFQGESVIVYVDIYGISMIWDGYYTSLNRGSLENIQKQLKNS
jgi:hypothetical protein